MARKVDPAFNENSFADMVRDVAGDIVEDLQLIDQFVHPKTERESRCYRITYRSMDRVVTNAEINAMQELVRERVEADLGVELR